MSEKDESRTIELKDDEAAIVFTGSGLMRLHRRVEPHEYDHIVGATMLMLTAECERIAKAVELIYEEMDQRIAAAQSVRELMEKLFGVAADRKKEGE